MKEDQMKVFIRAVSGRQVLQWHVDFLVKYLERIGGAKE